MQNVVWYRRDLRTEDHQPLSLASAAGGCLPLFIADDSIWRGPDASWVRLDLGRLLHVKKIILEQNRRRHYR